MIVIPPSDKLLESIIKDLNKLPAFTNSSLQILILIMMTSAKLCKCFDWLELKTQSGYPRYHN